MSHYKSNVRDQEFNLFEVLGVDKALGEGEYGDLDADTAREMLGEIARLAEGPIAESFADGDRNPPVFDPKTHSVTLPESFKKSVRAMHRRRLGPRRPRRGARRHADAHGAACGRCIEHILGANPAVCMYGDGRRLRQDLLPPRHRGAEEVGRDGRRARLGLDHGAHRARRRFRRRRRPHQGRRSRTTARGTSRA